MKVIVTPKKYLWLTLGGNLFYLSLFLLLIIGGGFLQDNMADITLATILLLTVVTPLILAILGLFLLSKHHEKKHLARIGLAINVLMLLLFILSWFTIFTNDLNV